MILRTWLNELDYELVRGSLDVEVTEVVYDSRKAVPGAVFVCMAGARGDSPRVGPPHPTPTRHSRCPLAPRAKWHSCDHAGILIRRKQSHRR